MSLHVACASCHTTFPLETHAGLVRCARCADRTGFRLPAATAHVIEVPAGPW